MRLFYRFFTQPVRLRNPRRFRYTEVSFSDGVVGRYGNLFFTVSETDGDYEVEFGGIPSIENGKITLSVKPDDEVVYDYVPALLGELFTIERLREKCESLVEKLKNAEMEVVEKALKEYPNPEQAIEYVSKLYSGLLKDFLEFKRVSSELFSAVLRFEFFCKILSLNPIDFGKEVERFKFFESRFEKALSGLRDILHIMSLKLDTARNREYLELQRRTSSLQAATAVIEFVAVFYYTLKIWAHFEHVGANPVTFSLLLTFTTLIVLYTDAMGEVIREKRVTQKFAILTVGIAVVVLLMITYPIWK